MRIVTALLLASCLALTVWPALAFVPHTGDRAAPLSGRDLQTNETLQLEDLRGKWVLLDFWYANCPPCKRDLPIVCETAKPYIDSGLLELVLVSFDDDETTAAMKDFLSTLPYLPHMIYTGKSMLPIGPPELVIPHLDEYAPQAVEWGINGVPATYLITPDGVIAAKRLRANQLSDILAYFIERGPTAPPVGLRTSTSWDESSQITLLIEATSSSHEPLQVRLVYRLEHIVTKDYLGYPIQDRQATTRAEPVKQEWCLIFDEFGEVAEPVIVDATGYEGLWYKVEVLLPGSEKLQDGAGIWLQQCGDVDFVLDWRNGESSNA